MLSEGSSVKGSPEDKQSSGTYIRESAQIHGRHSTSVRIEGFLLTTYETWQSIVYTDRLKSHML